MLSHIGQTTGPDTATQNRLVVRAMSGEQELEQVHRLAHDGYVQRGYCTPQPDGRLHYCQHLDHLAQTLVLGAFQDGTLVGTVSVTQDGDYAMPVDAVFASEYDAIRREAPSVGVIWRLATHNDYRDDPRLVVALLQGVIHHQVRRGIDVHVCTLHIRHERIYRRLFGMQVVARRHGIKALANLPAVFMRSDVEHCHSRWFPQDRLVNQETAASMQVTAPGQHPPHWTNQRQPIGAGDITLAA